MGNGASQSLRAPFAFITNTNSNYSIKWKKRKSLTIRLVATVLRICDKLRASTHLRVAKGEEYRT